MLSSIESILSVRPGFEGRRAVNRLAFICEANVCRSRVMQLTFASRVDADEWTVESFGTRPTYTGICEVASAVVGRTTNHQAQSIKDLDIDAQDLIITASRKEQAVLSTTAPHVRWRIFTLREAVALAAQGISAAERNEEPVLAVSGGLRHFASILQLRRGFIAPAGSGIKGGAEDAWDIRDAHGRREARHRKALREVMEETVTLHEKIMAFLAVNLGVSCRW